MKKQLSELLNWILPYNKTAKIEGDRVIIEGNLDLSYNSLISLPESFGNLKVGGVINLENNPIKDPSKENNENLPVFIKQPLSKNILQNKFSSGYIKSMQDIDSLYSSANDDEPPEPLKI